MSSKIASYNGLRETDILFNRVGKKMYAKMYAHKKIAPGALTPRATKTLILFYFIMAGVEGLEPPAPGFGDRCSTN
jgi:hypothetical protein